MSPFSPRIALSCLSIVLNMSETLKLSIAKDLYIDPDQCLIDEPSSEEDVSEHVATEKSKKRNQKILASILKKICDQETTDAPEKNGIHSNLVRVPSLEQNLRTVKIAIDAGKCVCLQGEKD